MKPSIASHFALLQIPSLALMALVIAFNPDSACAQAPSQGPAVIRVPTPDSSLDSNSLGYGTNGIVEHVFFTKDLMSRAPHLYYGFSEGRDTRTGPLRASAFWYNAATQGVTLVNDLAGIRGNGDLGPVCDPGLTVLTTWTPSGIKYSTRNAPTGPWGPLAPVTGIWSSSYAATPCWVQGKLHLMWDDERNNLSIGDFNSTNGAVTNARTLVTNPATGPSFFCHSPTPQNDDQGEMQGLAFIVRQRGLFNTSAICTTYRLDDKGPKYKVWEDTALYQPGGFIGGSFYSARLALAAPVTNATIRLDLGNTACASIPTAGGRASLFLWAPRKNPSAQLWAAVLIMGFLTSTGPIELPGVNGKIYIDPATMLLFPILWLPPTSGFGRYDLMTPPVQRDFLVRMQPVFVDLSGATFVGNLATVTSH